MSILEFNWECVLLLAFTFYLVASDRAFSKRVRREFQVALFSCFFLILLNHHFSANLIKTGIVSDILQVIELIIRPLILFLLVSLTLKCKRIYHVLLLIPLVVDSVLIVLDLYSYCFIASCFYSVFLIGMLAHKRNRREIADVVFSIILCIMLVVAICAENFLANVTIVNSSLSIITCIYYFYFVMRTYKKDRLTGLLIRHNLNFEMEDNINKSYNIVLIDVDNFKIINDKYGHDKGDEALVTIVNASLKHLPKGCRMYRFGGDEFVVISQKVSGSELAEVFERINEDISQYNYRISYGIVEHAPGTDGLVSLTEADKAMYENKRMIKSEDIWDDMTGLYNLRGFLDELDIFRKAVNKDKHLVCLIGVDVERLSNINMAYGYSEGNLIITTLSKYLKKCLHGRDFIGHLGSDEFVVAVECQSRDDSYIPIFMSQIQEFMDNSDELASKDYSVKLNIDRYFIDIDDLEASEAYVNDLLYMKQEDKDNRRKNDMSEEDKDYNDEDDALVMDILDNNKLQYAFQPIVSAKDGNIIAYESLMRSDTETMVTPLKILKYAERNKRSYDVEKLTMFNSLAKFSQCENLPENAKIFINSIPGHFLNDIDFDVLKNKYADYLERTVIEITEHRDIDDDSLIILNSRRDRNGFSLAIDDYGSGCSNTTNLLRYMPQIVKLDRLLIAGIDRNTKKQFFVSSIILFAKDNDMLTLAEGVETESELKTVIKLGVDMVQGYIVSKPSVDIITEIPLNIKELIVNENLKVGSNPRMVYTAGDNCELSVVQLAMEDYSKINVSANILTITGSSEYTADMIIKIKDNTNCHMTLSDVKLNSVDDKPCIELGENVNLTLNIEGTTRLNAKGIYVPESSTLSVIGNGTLQILAKGQECYAIGTDTQTAFGNITLKSSGLIILNVDGEECSGIGGGIGGDNSAINILSGTVTLTVAGVNAVGIGAYKGHVPIRYRDTELAIVFRVNKGSVMGTLDGTQDIEIRNFTIDITGSGTDIAVLGSPDECTGNITLYAGSLKNKFSGHNIYFYGGETGDVNIDISHCSLSTLGEGDNITGFGTRSEEAVLAIQESSVDLTINASSPLGIGAKEKTIKYIGPNKNFNINGITSDITEQL